MGFTSLKRAAIVMIAGASIFVATGCATKNYVRKEMTPLINKTNELDDLTAQTTRDIRDTDERAQKGISMVDAKAVAADQKATTAGQTAGQAQELANSALSRAELLAKQVENLDNYRPVAEAAVHFGFDKANLTQRAKEALDQLAAEIPNTKGFIVEILGGADKSGDAQYNYQLSKRRAASVVQYLAEQHNVPAHKIYVIGIGEDKPVGESAAKDRRVEVRLMTNVVEGQTTPSAAMTR